MSRLFRAIGVARPFAVAIIAGLEFVGGGNYADVILAAGSAVFEVPLQILLWGTIAFAFMERADAARRLRADVLSMVGPWKLERLPDTTPRRVSASEAAGEIVTVLITIGAFIFLTTLTVPGENGAHELLHGDFTNFVYPVLLASLIVRSALQLFAFAVGRWTTYLAIVNALLQLVFAVPIIAFALGGNLIDPFFAEGIGWPSLPDATSWPMLAVAIGTTLATAFEIVRGFVRARPGSTLGSMLRMTRPTA